MMSRPAFWAHLFAALFLAPSHSSRAAVLPLVLNTWSGDFTGATHTAFDVLSQPGPAGDRLNALEKGLNYCELHQCGGSVGFGGHPDASGEVTLDAMIMDAVTHDVGGVGGLRRVKRAISVARGVLEHTNHSIVVGDAATRFAVEFLGMEEETLSTPESEKAFEVWEEGGCQPNYYRGFVNCTTACPPYQLSDNDKEEKMKKPGTGISSSSSGRSSIKRQARFSPHVHEGNHDTIGMVVIDAQGDLACGVTTNGLGNKVPGRVGDSPLPGSGCYVENDVGGCACTGDGDVMLRFAPSAHAVMFMEGGASPTEAAERMIRKVAAFYPGYRGGMVCVNKRGEYGAAGYNFGLSFSVKGAGMQEVETFDVTPLGGVRKGGRKEKEEEKEESVARID
ncbi:n-(beta-n-acetylglucosaminyl)-l-asparaginase [Nannochloropsis oceanica]